jgi:hypothetical protein
MVQLDVIKPLSGSSCVRKLNRCVSNFPILSHCPECQSALSGTQFNAYRNVDTIDFLATVVDTTLKLTNVQSAEVSYDVANLFHP